MDNHSNYPDNFYKYKFSKGENAYNGYNRQNRKESSRSKSDEDLIIEENTIYEIDRECIERLKRNRKR